MKQLYKITTLLGLITLSTFAIAADAVIKVHAPWVQDAPPMVKVHAAYVTLENTSAHAIAIVDTSSPDFKKVEIHKSEIHQGMAKMTHQKRLQIPAHSRVEFNPGGYHFMLMDKKHPLQPGDKVTITLTLSDGSETVFSAKVQKRMGHSGHDHSGHSH